MHVHSDKLIDSEARPDVGGQMLYLANRSGCIVRQSHGRWS